MSDDDTVPDAEAVDGNSPLASHAADHNTEAEAEIESRTMGFVGHIRIDIDIDPDCDECWVLSVAVWYHF